MAQSLVELAKELTLALVQTGNVSAENMQDTLVKTYATLAAFKAQEEFETSISVPMVESLPVDWRKNITRHTVTCLECGDTFKQLSTRHLRVHGLDSRSYRIKYGIPQSVPLAARATTERRRQVVRETRPWEKAPAYIKGQARKGTASPEPEAETLPEETEAPQTAASAQPKRQRKATSKKKASPKTTAQG
jgi:predicted transcriptional regulator